jgi:hypothetical protein
MEYGWMIDKIYGSEKQLNTERLAGISSGSFFCNLGIWTPGT